MADRIAPGQRGRLVGIVSYGWIFSPPPPNAPVGRGAPRSGASVRFCSIRFYSVLFGSLRLGIQLESKWNPPGFQWGYNRAYSNRIFIHNIQVPMRSGRIRERCRMGKAFFPAGRLCSFLCRQRAEKGMALHACLPGRSFFCGRRVSGSLPDSGKGEALSGTGKSSDRLP